MQLDSILTNQGQSYSENLEDSEFFYEYNEVAKTVSKIFIEEIANLKNEIKELENIDQYNVSNRPFYDVLTKISCCCSFCVPVIGIPIAVYVTPYAWIHTTTCCALSLVSCVGSYQKSRREKESLEQFFQNEYSLRQKKIKTLEFQIETILGEDCKAFCTEHKYNNLTYLLQNPKFYDFLKLNLKIKNLRENQSRSDSNQEKLDSLFEEKFALQRQISDLVIRGFS